MREQQRQSSGAGSKAQLCSLGNSTQDAPGLCQHCLIPAGDGKKPGKKKTMEENLLNSKFLHLQTVLCCSRCGFAVNSPKPRALPSQFRLAASSPFRRNNFHGPLTTITTIHFYLCGSRWNSRAGERRQACFRAAESCCSLIHRLLPSAVTFCSSSPCPSL